MDDKYGLMGKINSLLGAEHNGKPIHKAMIFINQGVISSIEFNYGYKRFSTGIFFEEFDFLESLKEFSGFEFDGCPVNEVVIELSQVDNNELLSIDIHYNPGDSRKIGIVSLNSNLSEISRREKVLSNDPWPGYERQ